MLLEHLDHEHRLPARAGSSPAKLRQELGIALDTEGRPLEEVLQKLQRILVETPSSASPRFFNQLFGGRDPVATLAEMLTPLTNTSMYTYKVAGAQVLVEQEVLARMASKVGYRSGEGMLSPGGSLGNLTALLLARNEALADAHEQGVGGEALAVYTSVDGHYSVRKNAGILGMGRRSVQDVPTDSPGRMNVTELRRMIRQDRKAGRRPLLVNATAGTTVLGAFDPIREIAGVARDNDVWLHVDGALGGSVLLCEEHRHLLDGSELSDSFLWNPHKMMGVPLPCSALLLRRRGLLTKHLSETADYLFQSDEDELNPGTRSLQCGRRNDALKLWAAWQLHGDRGYSERLEHLFRLARHAAELIDADPELELLQPPQSINVCFQVLGKASAEICDRLDREGRLKIGHGVVDGRRAIRLVCVNPDLREADIESVLREIKQTAAQV